MTHHQMHFPGIEPGRRYSRSSSKAREAVLRWCQERTTSGALVRKGNPILVAWIANDTRLSPRAVRYAIDQLVADGKIGKRRRCHGLTIELLTTTCLSLCRSQAGASLYKTIKPKTYYVNHGKRPKREPEPPAIPWWAADGAKTEDEGWQKVWAECDRRGIGRPKRV